MLEAEKLLRLEPETIKRYVKESAHYQNDLQAVASETLAGDPLYEKLMERVMSFQVQNETVWRKGVAPEQALRDAKNSTNFDVRRAIDAALRQLLRQTVLTFEPDLKRKCLVKTYSWFYRQLEAIGDLSLEEKEEAAGILDPESVDRRKKDQEERKLRK